MKILLAFAVSLLFALRCGAGEVSPVITFALPDIEGRINVGIFDAKGRLVRTLFHDASMQDFTIGLNGLITVWDGNNDVGQRMPPGVYSAKGYIVGSLDVQGVASYFNDWVDDDPSLQILRVLDFKLLDDGGLVVVARVFNPETQGERVELFRIRSDGAVEWKNVFDPNLIIGDSNKGECFQFDVQSNALLDPASLFFAVKLAVNANVAFVADLKKLSAFDLKSGKLIKETPISVARLPIIACNDYSLFISREDDLAAIELTSLRQTSVESLPERFAALDANDSSLIGAGEKIWRRIGKAWSEVPVACAGQISTIALGFEKTFWVAQQKTEIPDCYVGQFDFSGQYLRELREDQGGFQPQAVSACRKSEQIALLEQNATSQRLRILKPVITGTTVPQTQWRVEFVRSITNCKNFGNVNGHLVADAGSGPSAKPELKFRLAENSLLEGKRPILALRAAFDRSGSWLETEDGLRLVRVSDSPGIQRIAMVRKDSPDAVSLFQGNSAEVEEFSISGLQQIAEIDAGSFELK